MNTKQVMEEIKRIKIGMLNDPPREIEGVEGGKHHVYRVPNMRLGDRVRVLEGK